MLEWSRNQAKLLRMAEHGGQTYAVHGPVRSGKTMSAVHGWMRNACKNFAGHTFIIASRSQRQLGAVVVAYMREFARENQMIVRSGKEGFLVNSWLGGPPNLFVPLIGNDVGAEGKAAGFTAAGAFMDECHKMPQDFINVVRERCISVPGSKVVMVMNPEGPSHWLKKEVIDEADNETIFDLPFQISDNETLTREQVDLLYRIYPAGPMRERRINGKWVATEGAVYPHFQDAVRPPPKGELPYRHSVSIDHARSSVTHALRFDWYRTGIWCAAEWRHDGRTLGPKEDVAQAQEIYRALARSNNVADWYCDPAAMEFQVALGNLLGKRVTPAENDVLLGIEKANEWMANGTVNISPACHELIGELHGYVWDEKASERGEDKPVKENDHGCDAFRYFCFTTAGRQAIGMQAPRIIRAATH